MKFIRLFFWQTDRRLLQQLPVEGRVGTSTFNHAVEPAKAITQDHRLQRVKPRDITKLGDRIAVDETMIPQQPNARGNLVGIGRDEPGIAQSVKNLERMSRETPD